MSDKKPDGSSKLDAGIRISLRHKQLLEATRIEQTEQLNKLETVISSSEILLTSLGYQLPEAGPETAIVKASAQAHPQKTWDEILAEAEETTPDDIDFDMLLSESEINGVLEKHAKIGSELSWLSSLDRFDVAISVASGVIAGVIDVLLVAVPAHAKFMGGAGSEGGRLSNAIKEKIGAIFTPETIKELEKANWVPFDPSTSRRLKIPVNGLCPRSHRFQSLGHDPLLGFVFGVRDILTGKFSAISNDGHLIIQNVASPLLDGEFLVIRILEAMKTQLGHLVSDVATPAGLPAPLMPLLSFLKFGKIGDHEHTIAEVARAMYGKGYDFRHFMASSIPVMITETIIRLGYVIKKIRAGNTLMESIPNASSLKLRRQLLIAHSVAMLINAGKVYVTQNPLAISWSQTLVFLRYVAPELFFLIYGKESARSKLVEEEIIRDYQSINAEIDRYLEKNGDFILVV